MCDARVQADPHGVDGAKHEVKLGARMTVLYCDHPLPAGADAFGECRLIEFDRFASVANDGAKIGERPDQQRVS